MELSHSSGTFIDKISFEYSTSYLTKFFRLNLRLASGGTAELQYVSSFSVGEKYLAYSLARGSFALPCCSNSKKNTLSGFRILVLWYSRIDFQASRIIRRALVELNSSPSNLRRSSISGYIEYCLPAHQTAAG